MLIIFRVRTFVQFLLTLFLLLFMLPPTHADLVPFGTQWKYLDNGSSPLVGWQFNDFDDNSWASGPGPLGYGDGDEATVVGYGTDSRNKHITTYFRHRFDVQSLPSDPLRLSVQRDDGIVVYLNGSEVLRNNMPNGAIGPQTLASSPIHGPGESALQNYHINPGALAIGPNTLAVEIHQSHRTSNDISFDLRLTDNPVVRGPYLQQSSQTGITIRWRTATDRTTLLRYGTNPGNLDQLASDPTTSVDHIITLSGLEPGTRYYYRIGDSNGDFTTGDGQYFDTHPTAGSSAATRIWVLGDSGSADALAAAVRNSYTQFNGGTHSDVWLMLGDNAYNEGTDVEYQAAVFDMYPNVLRNSVLWPTLGNHDAHSADSPTQSGNYYDIFTLPTAGESGGVASGTEAYYSFDYANIHFISLDSHDTNRSSDGAMATWLENDLAANTQEWIIAFWHHPPYSKGSHDSDTDQRLIDMRNNFLPILESHGVDLVLAGHSHSYERSMLINGHYETSNTFNSTYILDDGNGDPADDGAYLKHNGSNNGAVYSVAGSSGRISNATLDHPVMISNFIELGSMIIDVHGNQLDARFLNSDASVRDQFRIVHQSQQHNDTAPIEIGSAILDHDRVDGNRWTRMNFNPQVTGTHTVRVSWSGNADIQFTLFLVRSGSPDQRIDTISTDSPAQWTGTLDNSEQYYLGVWSASGSASISAFLEVEDPVTDIEPTNLLLGQGTLDSNRNQGPRWVRLNFDSLTAGEHRISVTWENVDADVRFKVRKADGTELSPTIRGDNPAVWIGMLEDNAEYFIGLWSTDGITNYDATIEANVDF